VALAPLADAAARDFAPLAPGVELRSAVAPGPAGAPLAAHADPAALRQVLLNLLDNAVRYGPPGQTVTVGASADDAGGVAIWVDDEGPGIPPASRGRVWEPFVRLPARAGPARAPAATPGSGLGLAVVADLARLQGGRAWVRDAPGGGARVGVTLPAADLRADPPVAGLPRSA
jgi:signal transduction histidine kinase